MRSSRIGRIIGGYVLSWKILEQYLLKHSLSVHDIKDGIFCKRDFSWRVDELEEALQCYLPKVKSRGIVVYHHESWSIDRDIVDILGKTYDIDPVFLRTQSDYKDC